MRTPHVALGDPPDSVAALRKLRAACPRLLADYRARRRHGRPDAAELLVVLDPALVLDVPADAYARLLEDALQRSHSASGAVRARLLRAHGRFWTLRGGQRIALEAVAEARRALADGDDDALATSMLAFVAAHAAGELGDTARVADEVRVLGGLARGGGPQAMRLEALAHLGQGLLDTLSGRVSSAASAFDAAIDASRRAGAERTLAIALANRSGVLLDLGEEEQSESAARKAGALFAAVGDALHCAQIRGDLALRGRGGLDAGRVLAAARAAERAGDARTVADLLLALVERGRGGTGARQQRQLWLQRAWRLLAHVDAPELERRARRLGDVGEPGRVLEVSADGCRARWDGADIDLSRRKALPGVLSALVAARLAGGERFVSVTDLFAAGWPDEKALTHAAAARVYMAVRALRGAGLRDAIRSGPGGYCLDDRIEVAVRGQRPPSGRRGFRLI
jgi:hypothetical protein